MSYVTQPARRNGWEHHSDFRILPTGVWWGGSPAGRGPPYLARGSPPLEEGAQGTHSGGGATPMTFTVKFLLQSG